jgi:hypothetical protein
LNVERKTWVQLFKVQRQITSQRKTLEVAHDPNRRT